MPLYMILLERIWHFTLKKLNVGVAVSLMIFTKTKLVLTILKNILQLTQWIPLSRLYHKKHNVQVWKFSDFYIWKHYWNWLAITLNLRIILFISSLFHFLCRLSPNARLSAIKLARNTFSSLKIFISVMNYRPFPFHTLGNERW